MSGDNDSLGWGFVIQAGDGDGSLSVTSTLAHARETVMSPESLVTDSEDSSKLLQHAPEGNAAALRLIDNAVYGGSTQSSTVVPPATTTPSRGCPDAHADLFPAGAPAEGEKDVEETSSKNVKKVKDLDLPEELDAWLKGVCKLGGGTRSSGLEATTRRGKVQGLLHNHLTLMLKTLLEKLQIAMNGKEEVMNRDTRQRAADLLAFVVDGMQEEDISVIVQNLLVCAKSPEPEKSRAGLRALRNLVEQSVVLRQLILKEEGTWKEEFGGFLNRDDAESRVYLMEIISSVADEASRRHLASGGNICNLSPVVSLLNCCYEMTDTEKSFFLKQVLDTLEALKSDELVKIFSEDKEQEKLDTVWSLADPQCSYGLHESAMCLLSALISFEEDTITRKSLERVGNLIHWCVTSSQGFKLYALKACRGIQEQMKQDFGQRIDETHLAVFRHPLMSTNDGDPLMGDLQSLCLSMILDLLDTNREILYDVDLVKPVVALLCSKHKEVQKGAILVLHSMVNQDATGVLNQADRDILVDNLVGVLKEDSDLKTKPHIYQIITKISEVEGSWAKHESGGSIVAALVANLGEVEKTIILPTVTAMLSESCVNCEEAVASGLITFLNNEISKRERTYLSSYAELLALLLHNTSSQALDRISQAGFGFVDALVRHIHAELEHRQDNNDELIICSLVESLAGILTSSEEFATFVQEDNLSLLAELLSSGNANLEYGALLILKHFIRDFLRCSCRKKLSKVLVPLCKLFPKYAESHDRGNAVALDLLILGEAGMSYPKFVAECIMQVNGEESEVLDFIWTSIRESKDISQHLFNGLIQVLGEARDIENKMLKDQSDQAEAFQLRETNQKHNLEKMELANQLLEEKVYQLTVELESNNQHAEEAGVRMQALTCEVQELEAMLVKRQIELDQAVAERATIEENSRVLKACIDEQNNYIKSISVHRSVESVL